MDVTVSPSILERKRKIIYLAAAVSIVVIFVALAYFFYPKPQTPLQTSGESSADTVIAKVGEESIFQRDLDTEIQYYPKEAKIDPKKVLLEKIIQDSVILQGAQTEKLITLDQSIYNSPTKDYLKRVKVVEDAKKAVGEKSDSIQGTVISIWFYNIKPAAMGYEKGKETAFTKISQLQKEVKEKKITAEQAAEIIRNDTSLGEVDVQYKTNASFDFSATKDRRITFDPDFDNKLWGLNPGEVTDVYLAGITEPGTGQKTDTVYLFGYLDKKVSSGKIANLDDWISKKRKDYAVTYF